MTLEVFDLCELTIAKCAFVPFLVGIDHAVRRTRVDLAKTEYNALTTMR
jgi:hypothetical protein